MKIKVNIPLNCIYLYHIRSFYCGKKKQKIITVLYKTPRVFLYIPTFVSAVQNMKKEKINKKRICIQTAIDNYCYCYDHILYSYHGSL